MSATCAVTECNRQAATRGEGYCWGHYKQKIRHGVLKPLLDPRGGVKSSISPVDRLRNAALAYSAADSEEDWVRANNRLCEAAVNYASKRRFFSKSARRKAG